MAEGLEDGAALRADKPGDMRIMVMMMMLMMMMMMMMMMAAPEQAAGGAGNVPDAVPRAARDHGEQAHHLQPRGGGPGELGLVSWPQYSPLIGPDDE